MLELGKSSLSSAFTGNVDGNMEFVQLQDFSLIYSSRSAWI